MRSFRGIRLVQQTEQKYLRVSLQNKQKKPVTAIAGLFDCESAD